MAQAKTLGTGALLRAYAFAGLAAVLAGGPVGLAHAQQSTAGEAVDGAAQELELNEQKMRAEEKEAARAAAEKAQRESQLKREEAERAGRAGEALERRRQRELRVKELIQR